jgi:DNA-binding transcriptional LysR family regulator
MPAEPQDLLAHECLRMKDAPWTLIHRYGRSQTIEVSGQFVANNRGMLQQLALGGQGIVQSADSWVQADLAAQRLVRVLPDWAPPVVEAYALTATRLLPAKVRVFMDYLVAQMAQPELSRMA